MIAELLKKFSECFDGKKPEIISRASGRAELIGGHTDYNEGFVIAATIDNSFYVAAAPRNDNKICMYSEWAREKYEFNLSTELQADKKIKWANYGIGVCALLLQESLKITGADLYISGNVPVGSGLSSSAALEVALAKAMIGQQDIDGTKLAKICQKAENVYAASPCGIMDQMVVINGRKNYAVLLDCRDLSIEHVPLESDKCCIMIFNSMVRHEVGSGEYGKRRNHCRQVVDVIAKENPHIKAMRDVDKNLLESFKLKLDKLSYKRASHVVSENRRVLAAAEALKSGDVSQFGSLMYQSHCSARDLYEISCNEIDFLVEKIMACDGTVGARLSGGGFGGAAVAVAKPDFAESITEDVRAAYKERFDIDAEIYLTQPRQGTELIKL